MEATPTKEEIRDEEHNKERLSIALCKFCQIRLDSTVQLFKEGLQRIIFCPQCNRWDTVNMPTKGVELQTR